eukprot:CAMPEP_0171460430 /NCGR_PEP_ID=MMETSP0945-20130129/5307_1 /TAXON_ID=109269 /ORGANISM="Vaucheria litorea, Strain CCMP2940" /LENGTH=60 /DNA_ID=CAMNT_0011986627 /DNA_START=605 /DNA_END=783 /DNA_ORIENTATION=-
MTTLQFNSRADLQMDCPTKPLPPNITILAKGFDASLEKALVIRFKQRDELAIVDIRRKRL